MLDRQSVQNILCRLDWSKGLTREKLLSALLESNLALPNEFLSAIPPLEVFRSPEQLIQSVPDVVWTIHAEREKRALGQITIPREKQVMRAAGAP